MPLSNEKRDYYYKVLEAQRDSTEEDLKAAYKKMALKWHPDRHLSDKEVATKKFIEITDAYRALNRQRKRRSNPTPAEDASTVGPLFTPPASSKSSTRSMSSDGGFSAFRQPSTDSGTTPPSSPKPSMYATSLHTVSSSSPHDSGSRASQDHQPRPDLPPRPSHSSTNSTNSRASSASNSRGNGAGSMNVRPNEPSALRVPSPLRSSQPTQANSNQSLPNGEPASRSTAKVAPQPQPPPQTTTKPIPIPPPNLPKGSHAPHATIPTKGYNEDLRGYRPPLSSRGLGTSKQWAYSLRLTLEELYHGKQCRFRLTRYYLSKEKKRIVLDVEIPPGCKDGTKIMCRGVGHERRDGTFQDIVFIVREVKHDRFTRVMDDLVMDVQLPWVPSLETEIGELSFEGLDGQMFVVEIDYPNHRALEGDHTIIGAGMPIREDGKVTGTGNLIVKWEIYHSRTKWQALKRALHCGK